MVIITKAVGSTSNAINDCVNCNALGGHDHDIMLLSCTNKSLQPSASDASSFIGPRCNLEHNTHLKVNRYDVGEDSSDGKNEWTSSNESVLSVVGSSGSIPPKPHSLKSSTKSSFEVSSQPLSGHSMIGPPLPKGMACKELAIAE